MKGPKPKLDQWESLCHAFLIRSVLWPAQKVLIALMVIWQQRRRVWWRPWRHQDCSRFLLHRLHWLHEWLGLRCLECGHPGPLVTRYHFPSESSGQTAVTISFTLVTRHTRILRLINLDITISVLPLIRLTSKWLCAGLLSYWAC